MTSIHFCEEHLFARTPVRSLLLDGILLLSKITAFDLQRPTPRTRLSTIPLHLTCSLSVALLEENGMHAGHLPWSPDTAYTLSTPRQLTYGLRAGAVGTNWDPPLLRDGPSSISSSPEL